MKRIVLILLLSFIALTATLAQCRDFAEEIIRTKMSPYVHDGTYNAVTMKDGQSIEINKVFYADKPYRMVICGSPGIPPVEFTVYDEGKNPLYKNSNNSAVWDFTSTSSQKLFITIKVPVDKSASSKHLGGCVTVLFGMK